MWFSRKTTVGTVAGKTTLNSYTDAVNHMVRAAPVFYEPYDFSIRYGRFEQPELQAWKYLLCLYGIAENWRDWAEELAEFKAAMESMADDSDNESILCSFYRLCYGWNDSEYDRNEVKKMYETLFRPNARETFAAHLWSISFQMSTVDGYIYPTLLCGGGVQEKKIHDEYVSIPRMIFDQRSSQAPGGSNQ